MRAGKIVESGTLHMFVCLYAMSANLVDPDKGWSVPSCAQESKPNLNLLSNYSRNQKRALPPFNRCGFQPQSPCP